MTRKSRSLLLSTATVNWFNTWDHQITLPAKGWLAGAEVLQNFGARVDNGLFKDSAPLGLFTRRRLQPDFLSNVPSAQRSEIFCTFVDRLWSSSVASSSSDPYKKWETFEAAYRKAVIEPATSRYTAHWAMKSYLDHRLSCHASDASPDFLVGTYLSSFTVRHIRKMFAYPFECMPLEQMLSKVQRDAAQKKISFTPNDFILHEQAKIIHESYYSTDYPQPNKEGIKSEKDGPIFALACLLASNIRQTSTLDGYQFDTRSLPTKKELHLFPQLNIPYSIYTINNYKEARIGCDFYEKKRVLKPFSTWSTHPEWVCRYSVNWFHPGVLGWWCEQVAEELEKRAEEVHKLSGGRAKLDYVTFDNVTPSERLMEIDDPSCRSGDCHKGESCDQQHAHDDPDGATNHVRFVPTRDLFASFFRLLRAALQRRARVHPTLSDVLYRLRFLPNIPGSPLQVDSYAFSSLVEGYAMEQFLGHAWLTDGKQQSSTLDTLQRWMREGKWLLPFPSLGVGYNCKTPPPDPRVLPPPPEQAAHYLHSLSVLRLLLDSYPLPPPPSIPRPQPSSKVPPSCASILPAEVRQGRYPSAPPITTVAPVLPTGSFPGEPRYAHDVGILCGSSSYPSQPKSPIPATTDLPGLFFLMHQISVGFTEATRPSLWKERLFRLGPPSSPSRFVSSSSQGFPDAFFLGSYQGGFLVFSFLQFACWLEACVLPKERWKLGPFCLQRPPYGSWHTPSSLSLLHPAFATRYLYAGSSLLPRLFCSPPRTP